MIYHLLAKSNAFALPMALYFFAVPVIWYGRKKLEGVAYNVSFASNIGDLALCAMFGIGILVLQHQNVLPPMWLRGTPVQLGVLVIVAAVMGVATYLEDLKSPKQWMDIYHNVVVVPVFLYLVILLGSVIWVDGTKTQVLAAVACCAVWVILLAVDILDGRLNQRKWIEEHNPALHYSLK